ncbi:MAG: DNA mismatch repair endonuclease MutL [Phycisphaerales bacterium]
MPEPSAANSPGFVAASPRRIRTLPPLLVNQIAAGEVVDRPASVVKELIDNAIDAGAASIHLELQRGGIELIRVTDDGAGIHPDDLPLALAPHATSKIVAAEDLDRIATMGFRGEALASIASVSRMSIRSRRSSDQESGGGATEIDAEGDSISPPRPAPGPVGTVVTVRNLFFNTPARRKFLRTPATEQGHALDIAHELALSHPHIAFIITCDSKRVLDLPPAQSPTQRALAVLGEELADQFIVASADDFDDARGVSLWGLVGLPVLARATAKSQHVFLNGRPIRDKTIQHAIREAYRGLIEPGKYPTALIMLEMDPGAVDVNVHPAKTEVRFRDSSLVHGVVLRAIRDALRSADLTPAISSAFPSTVPYRSLPTTPGNRAGGGPPIHPAQPSLDAHLDAPRGLHGHDPSAPDSPSLHPADFADYFRRSIPAQTGGRLSYDALRAAMNDRADSTDSASPPLDPPYTPAPPTPAPHAPIPAALPSDRILQIHNSYVVTQDEHGILIIDQHALHERVMFEQLLARVRAANLESQRMLVPSIVRPPRRIMDRLDELAPLLARIGVQLEPIGPDSLGVHAFPTFLFSRGVDPGEFTAQLLERFDEDGFAPASHDATLPAPADEAVLHEVLDMMACKAAIKAGDRMSDLELRDLLRLREAAERSSNCPHGRPTSIRLTIKELEKRFGRS